MQEIARDLADLGDATIPLQYTGVKDRKGKEIYEGDVVMGLLGHYGAVSYSERSASFGVVFYGDEESRAWVESYYEVIGNIYENPELLEV